jgi:hypothetical protein
MAGLYPLKPGGSQEPGDAGNLGQKLVVGHHALSSFVTSAGSAPGGLFILAQTMKH